MNKIRIPTEQFAFIEVEHEGTPEEAIELHNRMVEAVKPKAGLPNKEWMQALDEYISTQKLQVEYWDKMSPEQQSTIQELKRSFARLDK